MFVLQSLTEKTYVGEDYCFSVTDIFEGYFVAICKKDEYDKNVKPEFTFVGIYRKDEGWTWEKIEELLVDRTFISEAVLIYLDQLLAHKKINKESRERRERDLVEEIKEEIQKSAASTIATCWTLEEASKYSHIGINRLRQEILKDTCPWVLWIADKKRIVKVEAFKEWLNQTWFVD